MDESHPRRDPGVTPDASGGGAAGDASGDGFLDALVGLDSICRYLALALAAAPPGAAVAGPDDDEPLDALLGLVSVHRTVSVVLAALGGEAVDTPPAEAAAWSREVLR